MALLLAVLAALAAPGLVAGPAPVGVVINYHHVDDDKPAAVSVRPETFDAHLDYLEDHGFNVWPLQRLVRTVAAGAEVPGRTVALTFDGGSASLRDVVWPRLRERGWPFTVFVAPEQIDAGDEAYVDWDDLRAMADDGATIASLSAAHEHLTQPRDDESEAEWRARVREQIATGQQRLAAEIGEAPPLFAWPYGEFSPAAQELLEEKGLVGFGLQSGPFGPESDFTALPRFPMAVGFDDLESFALKLRTRPLPVEATDPASGVMHPEDPEPVLELELGDAGFARTELGCYSRGEALALEEVAANGERLRVTGDAIEAPGRVRFVCTAPAREGDHWYWYSFQWMMPQADGSWYEG